jgi:hypothetical protein
MEKPQWLLPTMVHPDPQPDWGWPVEPLGEQWEPQSPANEPMSWVMPLESALGQPPQ